MAMIAAFPTAPAEAAALERYIMTEGSLAQVLGFRAVMFVIAAWVMVDKALLVGKADLKAAKTGLARGEAIDVGGVLGQSRIEVLGPAVDDMVHHGDHEPLFGTDVVDDAGLGEPTRPRDRVERQGLAAGEYFDRAFQEFGLRKCHADTVPTRW